MEHKGSLLHSKAPASGPYPQPDQCSPYLAIPLSGICLNIIFPLVLGLPSGLFPSSLPTKTLYAPLPHTCHVPRPSHSSSFGHPNNIWWGVQAISSPLCSLLHSPVTSSFLGLIILRSALLSNTLSLCSSLSVRDRTSHPYQIRQN